MRSSKATNNSSVLSIKIDSINVDSQTALSRQAPDLIAAANINQPETDTLNLPSTVAQSSSELVAYNNGGTSP